MASYSEDLSKKELHEIQGKFLYYCRKDSKFMADFIKNGFKGDCIIACGKSTPLEGVIYNIDPILAYDVNVIGGILYAEEETFTDSDTSKVLVLCYQELINREGTNLYQFIDEFAPNLLKPKYKWSKPMEAKKMKTFLEKALNPDTLDSVVGATNIVLHIYEEGGKAIWDFIGLSGGTNNIYTSSDRNCPFKGIKEITDRLISILNETGKIIKDVYVVGDFLNGLEGKVIARKHSDGEYTLTVF